MEKLGNITLYNADCMEIMKGFADKQFDICIVDPPYGIGEDGAKNHSRGKATNAKLYTPKSWDSCAPNKEYFDELIRVSKNQIIFGANHFISKYRMTALVGLFGIKKMGIMILQIAS